MDQTPEARVPGTGLELSPQQIRMVGYAFLDRCGLGSLAAEEIQFTSRADGPQVEGPIALTDWPLVCPDATSFLLKDLKLDPSSAEWAAKRTSYRQMIVKYAVEGGLDKDKIPDDTTM